jgi:hypothetical protein
MVCTYHGIVFSHERSEVLINATRWKNLEYIILKKKKADAKLRLTPGCVPVLTLLHLRVSFLLVTFCLPKSLQSTKAECMLSTKES